MLGDPKNSNVLYVWVTIKEGMSTYGVPPVSQCLTHLAGMLPALKDPLGDIEKDALPQLPQ